MVIQAVKDGQPAGYVRSISQKYGRFSLVPDIEKAKKYASYDRAMGEVDDLTKFGFGKGYVFIIL